MAITRELLSGSTNGRGIKVAATATAGTLIHTAHATAKDDIQLYIENKHTADVLVTIEWGGATDPDDIEEVTLSKAAVLTLDGSRALNRRTLTGSVVVRAFASVANVVTVTGFVDRIA
jgi:hypothetical protein